jgi:hypothetical protein
MDEAGRSFENVGQSEFLPDNRPQVRFEDVPRRNYVESKLDPKEKVWNEILAEIPFHEDIQKLRNYFDNRWEQAQGTAEAGQIRMDLPKSDRVKPLADLGVTSRYADELAFKKFAKPYDKTRQAEREMHWSEDMPDIDDKITSYFSDEVKSPGRQLQDKMYKGRPSHEAEQAKLFPKVQESMRGRSGPVKKLFQKPDGSLVDENGNVVMTAEESERLMYEKLKDF